MACTARVFICGYSGHVVIWSLGHLIRWLPGGDVEPQNIAALRRVDFV